MALPPIAATTVGSFPRPSWLGWRDEASRAEVHFYQTDATLKEAQDDATLVSLHEQEEAGLDLLTDGEQRRVGFINHVLAGIEGFDMEHKRDKAIRRREGSERPVPTVVGKVRRRGPIVVDDLRFARSHTTKPVKMCVPGPMTAIDTTFDAHYGDEAALAMDIAAALNEELRELQAAGADAIQIDEPAMTRWHEKVAAYGAKALDRCIEGITVPTFVHLCYGYPGGGDRQYFYEYPELLEMLMETRIAGFSVEFARSKYDASVLKGCGGRLVMYGCVDPGDVPEPYETVLARVKAALEYVPPERLLIAPDCGLMTVPRKLAREKVGQLARAARELRKA